MSDFDAVLEIKKNLLEEILRDSEDNKVDVKTIVEGRLKVVNDMQATLENTKEYKAFIEGVKNHLNWDNFYVKEYEPERDTYEDEEYERHGNFYRMSDDEALERAIEGLLNNHDSFEEFITGYVPEYIDLLKVIIERVR